MTATTKPTVLVFSLSSFKTDDNDAHLLRHLGAKSIVHVVTAQDDALRRLSTTPRPQAILLADQVVTERGHEALMRKLADYTKSGGTIVFGCRFSTFVKPNAMEAMFQRTLGLPWARGSYHRTTVFLNRRVDNLNIDSLPSSYSMKAMHLKHVAPTAAVYLPTEASRIESLVYSPTRIQNLEESPAVFAKTGLGYVGFVGDVNEEEPTTHLLVAMLLASSQKRDDAASTPVRDSRGAPRPSILVLSLHTDDHFDALNADMYAALRSRADVTQASNEGEALSALTKSPSPYAVLVADAGVMDEDHIAVFSKLLAYIDRRGSNTVFAGQFSSWVRFTDLDALLQRLGLGWRAGSYTKMDVTVTKSVDSVDFEALTEVHEYPKALFLQHVPWDQSVYVPTLQYRSNETMAALGWTDHGGRVGYVGDVNPSENITKLVLALCFPKTAPVGTQAAPEPQIAVQQAPPQPTSLDADNDNSTKPQVLLVSFDKEPSFESTEQQLLSALKKNAFVLEAFNADSVLEHLLKTPGPTAVIVTDSGFIRNDKVVQRLIQFVRAGGRVVLGCQFSSHIRRDQLQPFFHKWGLPWSSGAFHRSTFALNPAGIPSPLHSNKLFDAYSMKAGHLKNVDKGHRVYVPTSGSCVEMPSGQTGQSVSGPQLDECPAAWAPIGKGYLGCVNDINSEEESTRLILEMCGVSIKAGDLGPRTLTRVVAITSGRMTDCAETCAERQLPVRTERSQPRSREKEVAVRSVKRANMARRKRLVAETLREEGNKFFKSGKHDRAASRYRQAAIVYGPRPIYMSNLAASLLKLGRYEEAEAAASRALFYEPKNIKARYRRGIARKELSMYHSAIDDFKAILRQDPTSSAARTALQETVRLDNVPVLPGENIDEPQDDEPLWEIMTESDSSEYEHEGNGTPCRYLNHGGCRHGSDCRWKHATDERSVRDQLGRNVCLAWLVGSCIVGNRCYYAHDKTYLREGGRWSRSDQLIRLAKKLDFTLSGHIQTDRTLFLTAIFLLQDWRRGEWMSGQLSELDEETISVPGKPRGICVSTIQRDGEESEDDEDENEWDEEDERMNNLGFTQSEVDELLCQGVKPWDDDAWDVLDALRSM